MDSDYDSYCSDSNDYDRVSDDNYNNTCFDYEDDRDLLEEQDNASVSRTRQLGYTVLKEAGIKKQQDDDISEVSSVLLLSRVEATILLRHYNWNVSKVHDEWFADEQLTCGICFDSLPCDDFTSAACGHPFCQGCWEGYIHTIINDGPGCLSLRCPEPSCKAAVGQDMIDKLARCEDKEKYSRYLLKSYIEDNKQAKWCPAPGCENAVHITSGIENFDVSCICSHSFCWNCTEDVHRPVDCDTVNKWILKNSSESESLNWIIVNSKPCPKCKLPIEKNQGCMHMSCRPPCKYEFCWLCLGSWSKHGDSGGSYACNSYEEAKRKGELDEDLKSREMAKAALDKYTHYYERWETNQKSRQQALRSLHEMQTVHLDKLGDLQLTPKSQLKFITEAWLQIVECRRVLKWTYAYGYYIPEKEVARKQFFEHLQGAAESGLERLHQCAETKLNKFIYHDDASTENLNFDDLRSELTDLTRVTKNYFENLIEALENGLEDVNPEVAR